jgi:hypothetical protein
LFVFFASARAFLKLVSQTISSAMMNAGLSQLEAMQQLLMDLRRICVSPTGSFLFSKYIRDGKGR